MQCRKDDEKEQRVRVSEGETREERGRVRSRVVKSGRLDHPDFSPLRQIAKSA